MLKIIRANGIFGGGGGGVCVGLDWPEKCLKRENIYIYTYITVHNPPSSDFHSGESDRRSYSRLFNTVSYCPNLV